MIYFSVIIIFYALISSYGLYKLKVATEILSIDFGLGVFFYGSGFLIWMVILRSFPLSIAFPLAAASLILATQLFGVILLKESFSIINFIGIFLIIIGIAILYTRVK